MEIVMIRLISPQSQNSGHFKIMLPKLAIYDEILLNTLKCFLENIVVVI